MLLLALVPVPGPFPGAALCRPGWARGLLPAAAVGDAKSVRCSKLDLQAERRGGVVLCACHIAKLACGPCDVSRNVAHGRTNPGGWPGCMQQLATPPMHRRRAHGARFPRLHSSKRPAPTHHRRRAPSRARRAAPAHRAGAAATLNMGQQAERCAQRAAQGANGRAIHRRRRPRAAAAPPPHWHVLALVRRPRCRHGDGPGGGGRLRPHLRVGDSHPFAPAARAGLTACTGGDGCVRIELRPRGRGRRLPEQFAAAGRWKVYLSSRFSRRTPQRAFTATAPAVVRLKQVPAFV